jgi:hypothetical protein
MNESEQVVIEDGNTTMKSEMKDKSSSEVIE